VSERTGCTCLLALVMAGLVPAIYVFGSPAGKTWMPATSAGMTDQWPSIFRFIRDSMNLIAPTGP
jgi:hypothetical protein